MDLRQVPAQSVEHRVSAEDEDTRVPGVRRVLQVATGGRRVRLLHEGLHREHAGRLLRAPAEISVAGLRPRRVDAEGEQIAVRAGASRRRQRSPECIWPRDVVVARQHHQRGVAVLSQRMEAGEADGRSGVPRRGLDDQVGRRQAGQRLAHGFDMIRSAHDPRPRAGAERLHAQERLRDQRPPGDQRQELLGLLRARERPEARATPAGEDHCVQAHWPSRASSMSWCRMRAVAPHTTVPCTVYQWSSNI